jgi:hypothetical protein
LNPLGVGKYYKIHFFSGKSYFPHRTILKKQGLLKEIDEAGFTIIKFQVHSEPGNPDNFIALLKLKNQ